MLSSTVMSAVVEAKTIKYVIMRYFSISVNHNEENNPKSTLFTATDLFTFL